MAAIASTIVRAWEIGEESPAWQRPAALLSAFSGVSLEHALLLGVARRDAALLSWRAALFGGRWLAFAECPRCGAMLEYDMPVPREALEAPAEQIEVEAAGRTWAVRWPNSFDLAEAAACPDRQAARALLMKRILPGVSAPGCEPEIVTAIGAAHRACWKMDLRCCTCPGTWSVVFDAGEFVWRELRAAARHILREVDSIARIYHWSEAAILAMSDTRRKRYLEMV
jgi:hypothetical protein